jgi:hypothetical protein
MLVRSYTVLVINGTHTLLMRPRFAVNNIRMISAHQPGEDIFKAILPSEIVWSPYAGFPVGVQLAILVGSPPEPGPYVVRIHVPHGIKLLPHRHPEDRVYTVISGVFYIGRGDEFDADKLVAYPPGSLVVLPGETSHFHWAKSSDYIAQVQAIGPLGLGFVDPKNDLRI